MFKHLRQLRPLFLLVVLAASAALAAPTSIELSAEATRMAANDLIRATVFAEASGVTSGELARQVNGLIDEGLKTARSYPRVKTQSGSTYTSPIYTKDGKISGWSMRSNITMESADSAALSELLGKLQASLGVAGIVMLPSALTRKSAEDEAMLDALAAFKARARLIADALGKPYRIKHLSMNSNGGNPQPMYRFETKAMSAAMTPMPLEAGESQVTANVSGQIELLE